LGDSAFENGFQLRYTPRVTLDEAPIGAAVTVLSVGGERQFRRRIMELGLLPGTAVRVLRVAPLGDPIEVTTRGCNLSIRHAEARSITVTASPMSQHE
jgi:Fe2+ transport system protein FeoA